MAPKKVDGGSERSNRFRFVMLDADLSDANVNALATAIVSALWPEAPLLKRVSGPAAPPPQSRLAAPAAETNGNTGQEQPAPVEDTTEEHAAEETPATRPARTRKPIRPPQPEYVQALFPNATEANAFKAFIAQHPTRKDSERYLVAALYLRDHRSHPVVNMHDIYTCYRTVGDWPMTIGDGM